MRTLTLVRPALLLALGICLPLGLAALGADEPAAAPAAAARVATAPQLFDSTDAAMKALVAALNANDDGALEAMLGSEYDDLVQSGKDPVVARERKLIAGLITEKLTWETLDDGSQVAVVGFRAFPLPIPLAPKDGKWFFDGQAGRDEVIARRVGKHELAVMDILRTVVDAQEAYHAQDRDGDGVLEFAQKFISTSGTKDGLFWVDPEGVSLEDRSPLSAMAEDLLPYADGSSKGSPYSGYYFKLLTAQGPCAPGGAQSWLVGENLTGGFGVLAVPAEYRNTGIKSFIISHRGRLFEGDLGPEGAELAKTITTFQPDSTWTRVGNP